MICNIAAKFDSSYWFLDSGASHHFCCDFHILKNFTKYHCPRRVALGGDRVCPIIGEGTVELQLASGGLLSLHQVLFVPALTKNLLSTIVLGQLKLYRIVMEDDMTSITLKTAPDKVLMTGQPEKGLILLDARAINQKQLKAKVTSMDTTQLWHQRLGHSSFRKLNNL